MEPVFRKKFLEEMSMVGEAVYKAFKPDKLNLGKAVHMHWHFFPRRAGDTPTQGPVWKLNRDEMYAEKYHPHADELEKLKSTLAAELNKLIK